MVDTDPVFDSRLFRNPVLDEVMTGSYIVGLLRQYKIPTANELDMQDMVERILKHRGVEYSREHVLSARDRVDFFCGGVAVECKVAGSPADVLVQLQRYAEHESVLELVLVTSRGNHAFEATVNGKQLAVYCARPSFG